MQSIIVGKLGSILDKMTKSEDEVFATLGPYQISFKNFFLYGTNIDGTQERLQCPYLTNWQQQ